MDIKEKFIFLGILALCYGQSSIEDIRLIGGSTSYDGKVTIRYNGTWGTICSSSWGLSDARVACRMLGFSGAACARTNSYGRASASVPIWMANVGCSGSEQYLDACPFYGWGEQNHYCTRRSSYDAGVVCLNDSLIGIPEVIASRTTTRTITLTWRGVNTQISGLYRSRYVVHYADSTTSRLWYTSYSYYSTPARNTVTLTNLYRNQDYNISVRYDLTISRCGYYSNIQGAYSDPILVSTNNTLPPSRFDIRLRSPISRMNFLGRVEVYYSNIWGTVCDYSFDLTDANVMCNMLNYSRAICASYNGVLGRGSGTIWLNRLRCGSSAEILDNCGYYFWRSYTYGCSRYHYDDAGVICAPEPNEFARAPQNFNISSTSPTSLTFSWRRYSYSNYYLSWRLLIEYKRSDFGSYTFTQSVYYTYSSVTLYNLPTGVTVTASIRVQGRFSRYSCYTYIDGASSNKVTATTMERPPSGPPANFHIAVLNCTAIHAEWNLPSYNRRNGIIRGYKLMYSLSRGPETTVNLEGNITEYIIGSLSPSTSYDVSILAYTIGDGPRSIYLTVTTNDVNTCQTDIISSFGVNGNGLDKVLVYSYSTGINVFCSSSLRSVQIDWLYLNGTKVGVANLNVREGHYGNGTAVLLIGRFGSISICDAGIYICHANSSIGAQQKQFKVVYNNNPPTPGRPQVRNLTSSSLTVQWPRITCSGGHEIQYYNIRIGYYRYFYSSISYWNINNIDGRTSNYTIRGLNTRTNYFIAIRAQAKDYRYSSYSDTVTVTTLPPVPTPPRDVTVELVGVHTIYVTWSRPAATYGSISYYTVYATPFISQYSPVIRSKRQAQMLQISSKNFSAARNSGNLTLPQLGLEYHIQVKVTVLDTTTRINRHSLLSPLTSNSTIFVPIPGLPIPQNVRVIQTSNSTITVGWTNLGSNASITGYLVEFSAIIEGRSSLGNLISYSHSGNVTAPSSADRINVGPLVAGTEYLFRVAVLTTRGEGRQINVRSSTQRGTTVTEPFVYFHIRFGPVFSCQNFRRDIEGQEETVKYQLSSHLKQSCNCGMTDRHIMRGLYSCGQQNHQIIYRAQILGTRNYSAVDLLHMMQGWIATGRAYIIVSAFRMALDPSCPTRLDTLNDPECLSTSTYSPPFSTSTASNSPPFTTDSIKEIASTSKNIAKNDANILTERSQTEGNQKDNNDHSQTEENQSDNIGVTAIAGLFIGSVVSILLIVIIVMIVIIVVCKSPKRLDTSRSRNAWTTFSDNNSSLQFTEFENDDSWAKEEKGSINPTASLQL